MVDLIGDDLKDADNEVDLKNGTHERFSYLARVFVHCMKADGAAEPAGDINEMQLNRD